jgi:TPR repeat protein
MPDTNTQTVSKPDTAAAALHWRDSLMLLQHSTGFSINTFITGPTFRGWHEHFAAEGERWLRERANSGDLYACEKLGLRLIDGDGMEAAPEEGLQYLEQPVAADHPIAMTRLAEYLFSLDGASGTHIRAKQLLEHAAERYTFAKIALAMRFILGKGTEADPGRGKAALTELALKGTRRLGR